MIFPDILIRVSVFRQKVAHRSPIKENTKRMRVLKKKEKEKKKVLSPITNTSTR